MIQNCSLFKREDVMKAIDNTNFQKALGPDQFDGDCLKDDKIKENVSQILLRALNENKIPDYMKTAKMVLLSKN